MKKFWKYMILAATMVIVAAISVLGASASAESVEPSSNVVFISDNADSDGVVGDGSSAAKPLDPYTVPAHLLGETSTGVGGKYYLCTSLYQAAEILADTGGTIVICGPVTIGINDCYGSGSGQRDFFFPASDQVLKITSVYGGTDYAATNGAYLEIALPAQISLNSPTVFENMTIKTTGKDRVICGNGNKLIMGKGLTCSPTAASPSNADYLSVVGGSRYTGLMADTEVVIKSGDYNYVGGAQWGLDTSTPYTHTGNISISIEAGVIRGAVCGGPIKSATTKIDGDVTINVYSSARLGSPIYGSGQAQFATEGHTVDINIFGGGFYDTASKVYKYFTFNSTSYPIGANYPATEYNFNISGATVIARTSGSSANKILDSFVTSAVSEGFDEIRYPSKWVSSISVVSMPTASHTFVGQGVNMKGAKLKIDYKNAYDTTKTYQATLEYTDTDTAFKVIGDTYSAGQKTVTYRYGTKSYGTATVDVYEKPAVEIFGAQIQTSGSTQGLRFIANFNKGASSEVTVEEYGVIAVRGDLVEDRSCLDFDQMYGMTILTPNSNDINTKYGNSVYYSCTMKNIPINRFNIDTVARAYVKVKCNGESSYFYSDIISRNPYQIALLAAQGDSVESAEVRSFLKTNVIDVHENYSVENSYADATRYRTRVVDYMRAQMNLTWTPSETFWVNNPKDASGVTTNLYFEKGKTYKGIPYTNSNFSQKESFSDLISGGPLDISKIPGVTSCGNSTSDEATARENYLNFPGSDCSTAVITAWNTVLNGRPIHKNLVQTKYMVPGNNCGVIPVGDYSYDYEKYGNSTYAMVADSANASKVYAAYSLLMPGDAIVHYDASTGAGHARLVVSVNKTAKTVTTIECANWSIPNCSVTSGNGTKVSLTNNNTSWMELTYHFDYLLKDGYVPITVPELATGHSDGEYTLVTELDLENDIPNGKLSGKVASNRQIVSVNVTVSDGTSTKKIVHKPVPTSKTSDVHVTRVDLSLIDLRDIELVAGKEYTLSLDVRVVGLTNETPTVKLIDGYTFIAK